MLCPALHRFPNDPGASSRIMSSHHIIREKQEPALYIQRLGAFNEEHLGQLLEWSPTLLVAASEYEKLVSMGLKVDVVVGETGLPLLQENTHVLTAVSGSGLAELILHLIKEQYEALNIIGDSIDVQEVRPFLSQINMVLYSATEKTYALKPGFTVWKPQGSIFRFDASLQVQTHNLRKIGEDTFEVLADGFVAFNFTQDNLFVHEPL